MINIKIDNFRDPELYHSGSRIMKTFSETKAAYLAKVTCYRQHLPDMFIQIAL